MTNAQTLRPGLLVSLKTSLRGNITYWKTTIDEETVGEDGMARARWETQRTVVDPAELERGKKARSQAQTAIRRVCSHTAFGLLCPEAKADVLEEAIRKSRAIVDAFNADAQVSRLAVYVISGKVAADDVEAVKAINSEVRDLIGEMETAMAKLDVKAIRDAANRARQLGSMLTPQAEARVKIAIETARNAATAINKAAETGAAEVDKLAIQKLTEMRTSFLDFDDEQRELALPKSAGRAVDLTPETEDERIDREIEETAANVSAQQSELEMD